MAYLAIKINTKPVGPKESLSLGDVNAKILKNGTSTIDTSKPGEIVVNLRNLLDAINSGLVAADITIESSSDASDIVLSGADSVSGTIQLR